MLCRVCKHDKPQSEFYTTPAGNPRRVCKTCFRDADLARKDKNPEVWYEAKKYSVLKNKYGITREQYDALNEKQQGLCAICGNPEVWTWHGKVKWLSVDHDHRTGAVRGLLCHSCNVGIGHLRDDVELLLKAAAYLRGEND